MAIAYSLAMRMPFGATQVLPRQSFCVVRGGDKGERHHTIALRVLCGRTRLQPLPVREGADAPGLARATLPSLERCSDPGSPGHVGMSVALVKDVASAATEVVDVTGSWGLFEQQIRCTVQCCAPICEPLELQSLQGKRSGVIACTALVRREELLGWVLQWVVDGTWRPFYEHCTWCALWLTRSCCVTLVSS
eukprot:3508472-Amphidinium_carterae.1